MLAPRAAESASAQDAFQIAPRIFYLIHDADDPAIARRVRMLKWGGAEIVLAGFRRSDVARSEIEGAPLHDLGRTHDAKLWARAGKVAKIALRKLKPLVEEMREADIVLARNLEMLVLARAALARLGSRAHRPRLIYECLDVHRAMVGRSIKSQALRAIERALMKKVDLLMVSSPGFMRHYFEPMQGFKGEWLLVENKLLVEDTAAHPAPAPKPEGPPWRIGWFGVLRCQKSLDMLEALVKDGDGEIEVILRGRPAYHEFRDFDAQIKAAGSHLKFLGPYRQEELAQIYSEVHFAWAVDFCDAGANSDWLLPNRYYEAGAYGVPCIGRADTELSRRIRESAFGIAPQSLGRSVIGSIARSPRDCQRGKMISDARDCGALVQDLVRLCA